MERSLRWQHRSYLRYAEDLIYQSIYGVVHGSMCDHIDVELSVQTAQTIGSMPFDGFVLSTDKPTDFIPFIKTTMRLLPTERPRHVRNAPNLEAIRTYGL